MIRLMKQQINLEGVWGWNRFVEFSGSVHTGFNWTTMTLIFLSLMSNQKILTGRLPLDSHTKKLLVDILRFFYSILFVLLCFYSTAFLN